MFFQCIPKSKKPIKFWVLIENEAKAEMELDFGSAVSTALILHFRCLFPRYKMFPADVQLRSATKEVFRPDKVHVIYENKAKLVDIDWSLLNSPSYNYTHCFSLIGNNFISNCSRCMVQLFVLEILMSSFERYPSSKITISRGYLPPGRGSEALY